MIVLSIRVRKSDNWRPCCKKRITPVLSKNELYAQWYVTNSSALFGTKSGNFVFA
jgi:hypothetical protein